ncbi:MULTISPECIES: hypothetical protein [Bacillaceae]|uniref:Uncharacterized protein n=1 Tax=Domibacillus aminovorans TaxID=29332 RepID=A0A177KYW2_9BACI|nr:MULTISPECIES: hypothetical protein [Bacillaceae]OAH58326.1 hypothetical protein AWH48_18290 [Domibacillus aminovorans]
MTELQKSGVPITFKSMPINVYVSGINTPCERGSSCAKRNVGAGYEALRALVMATKTKRVKKSLLGFYNGVLDRILDNLYLKQLQSN